jgi:hypothetical protein
MVRGQKNERAKFLLHYNQSNTTTVLEVIIKRMVRGQENERAKFLLHYSQSNTITALDFFIKRMVRGQENERATFLLHYNQSNTTIALDFFIKKNGSRSGERAGQVLAALQPIQYNIIFIQQSHCLSHWYVHLSEMC